MKYMRIIDKVVGMTTTMKIVKNRVNKSLKGNRKIVMQTSLHPLLQQLHDEQHPLG